MDVINTLRNTPLPFPFNVIKTSDVIAGGTAVAKTVVNKGIKSTSVVTKNKTSSGSANADITISQDQLLGWGLIGGLFLLILLVVS